jgi:hypothetical protein
MFISVNGIKIFIWNIDTMFILHLDISFIHLHIEVCSKILYLGSVAS